MSALSIPEVIQLFDDEDERLEEVERGAWESDGKYELRTDIVKDTHTGKFYAIHQNRSGSYWSEYEYGDTEANEVKPVQVMVTQWEAVEG
ncbi:MULTISPECIES: hypothetical protein [Burkholderia]|uniref:hypothetical protein n=1 Tax=Burkholderia TaxID=32008 RepID=UPI000B79B609|nr:MULTISPECIES: hypothetical protein [Burkholderia]MBY4725714.1 hypothetical protein [Burkholderia contaminans]MCI3969252.1 hypothetical protein [Burkholderia sp. HI4860]OXI98485.1 hypothetical protein CFB48_24105 [Burkholderia sp. AU33647]